MNPESDTPNSGGFKTDKQSAELAQGPSVEDKITYARAKVEQIADKLGKTIDEAIKEPVVAFLASDIPTSGSCEGHIDHDTPYPWVEVHAPAPEGWKESEQKQQEWREANQILRTKMQDLLDRFYKNQPADPEVRLKIAGIGVFGAYRVQSPAELTSDEQPDEAKLTRYREEMNNFARFLLSGCS